MSKRRRKGPRGIFGFILAGLSACVSITLIVLMSLTACDVLNLIPEYVTVQFFGENNEKLDEIKILEFSEAKYSGPLPTKEPDSRGAYMFIGWDKRLKRVWHDTKVHAKFLPLSFFDFGGIGELPDIDLEKIPKVPVMQLQSSTPGVYYLRQRSYGDYASGSWGNPFKYEGRGLTPIDKTFTNPSNYAGYIGASNALMGPSPLSITYLKEFEYTPVPQYSTEASLKSNSDSYFRGAFHNGETYNTNSYFVDPVNLPDTLNRIKRADITDKQLEEIRKYEKFAQNAYRTVNKDVKPLIKDIVREDGIKSSDNNIYSEVVRAVSSRAEFNILASGKRDPNEDAIVKFLTKTKKGNASLFASTATQIFRYLNIPSRYVTGYIGAVLPEQVNTPVELYNLQVWSWCEVFVKDVGWIAIDPSFDGVKKQLSEGKLPGSLPGDGSSFDINLSLPDGVKYISKMYDDKPFTTDDVVVIDDKTKNELKSRGLKMKIDIDGLDEFKDVGKRLCEVNVRLFKKDKDVTDKYKFTNSLKQVLLEIKPIPLIIDIDDDVYVDYDGKYHTCAYKTSGLLPRHQVQFYPDQYKEAGEYEIAGNPVDVKVFDLYDPMMLDLSRNYDITIEKGSLIILEEVK